MATRSLICYTADNYTFKSIYCHSDGYPSYVGRILMEHYQDELKVKSLMELGNLSSLGAELGVQHNWEEQSDEYCTAYERDRGDLQEPCTITKGKKNLLETASNYYAEHIYLFINGHWSWFRVNGGTRWRKVTKEIVAVDYLEKLVLSEITSTTPDAPVTSVEGT